MDKKYVIGLIMGVFLMFLLGAAPRSPHVPLALRGHAGGIGTYQAQMSNDGKTIAVTDTRTGTTKIFNVHVGDNVLSFSDEERYIKEYVPVKQ